MVDGSMMDVLKSKQLPDSWSIVEVGLIGLFQSFRELTGLTIHVCIYSNCLPTLNLIHYMTPSGEHAGVLDVFTSPIQAIPAGVTIGWLPGQGT